MAASKVKVWFQNLKGWQRRTIEISAVALPVILALLLAYVFTHESSDDAYVTGHIHPISTRVTGTVLEVLVDDNQEVKKDQVLFKLDPADYQVLLQIAQANFKKAESDAERLGEKSKFQPDLKPLFDQYAAARSTTEANLHNAELQLQYTQIVAPVDGRVGKKIVEAGQRVQPGQALMAVVEHNNWIVANFKENQVGRMRIGQPAEIEIDAIPHKTFHGHVDSFSPASGASFALLPPDNATGNFTKIVQRIPVKIVLDPESVKGYEIRISPGMSVEVTVRTL